MYDQELGRPMTGKARYSGLVPYFGEDLPSRVFTPPRGAAPVATVLAAVGVTMVGGVFVGTAHVMLWPVLLLLPLFVAGSAMIGSRLGAAIAPKRILVCRRIPDFGLQLFNVVVETIPDTPSPAYLADYADKSTLRATLMPPPEESRSKLMTTSLVVGVLGVLGILWFFYAGAAGTAVTEVPPI